MASEWPIIANGQTIEAIRSLRSNIRIDDLLSVEGLEVGQIVKVVGRVGGNDGVDAAEHVIIRQIDGKNLIVDQCE